jgi:hypothetical protein
VIVAVQPSREGSRETPNAGSGVGSGLWVGRVEVRECVTAGPLAGGSAVVLVQPDNAITVMAAASRWRICHPETTKGSLVTCFPS